jgi:hypothetical protein
MVFAIKVQIFSFMIDLFAVAFVKIGVLLIRVIDTKTIED